MVVMGETENALSEMENYWFYKNKRSNLHAVVEELAQTFMAIPCLDEK